MASEPSKHLALTLLEIDPKEVGPLQLGRVSDNDRVIAEFNRHDSDHEQWDLDDAQQQVSEACAEDSERLEEVIQQVLPASIVTGGRLQYPVILPQRRPKRRHRGFIRAYAPDLHACGIDQMTFMAFLNELDKSTAWSPLVDIINLSTVATFAIPGGLGAAVAVPIQLATGIYKELQGRKGQNEFLQKMNIELFRPRGLYCLIVAHSNASEKQLTQDNVVANIGSRIEPATTFGDRFKTNFRNADGKFGPVEFPASAELVFPILDEAVGTNAESVAKKNAFARVIERYGARRDWKRTAKWIRKNPGSPLEALMDPKAAERAREKGLKKPKKRRLAKNLLYMMVVNMPSDEEMAEALRIAGEIENT
ncbi:hypothetical protein E0Z10_g2170 [Xylaria hypoxylon]|uniref:Uncharacterized protein n=1 Tax=Xylaria hypoxylon TaxID=37992 RepID=A0A4Z0YQJ8_9PEZI|nr:hypothetical protein E0Z10_g2170 [Xylaria hypoxylon]